MKKIILSTILGLGFLTSCTSSKIVNKDEETLTIAPETRECSAGVAKMQCMLVKKDNTSEWQYFYNQIDGFTHEPGYEYEIVVSKSKIENPPADASSLKYKLIKVVSKKLATME
ncbi:DUF4377 domain-containing protein [Empedobacter tilapiae]|uniref:DUF4377 domain-containing protein n=1 Tax=Empedobacter tilapiae TaxID=2491114 RepID=A0A4Z1BNT1_9FLAO|nr:DUF4377 domain-containing protein [Empedobacter tilapiae]TGN29187.1 DUF4377 domain-containing protein [Empedobacter tilapiae]